MEQTDPRREKLIAWRKATGRTPMKRISYVQEYHKPSPQSKCTETKTIHVHAMIQRSLVSKTPPLNSNRCKRWTSTRHVWESKEVRQRENVPPQVTKTPQQLNFQRPNKKLNRREMLDQWLAVCGSIVKKPRSVLSPLNQVRAQTEVKKRRPATQHKIPYSPCTMRKLREQFQREIDEDCRDELEMQVSGSMGGDYPVARELDFNESMDYSTTDTPPPSRKTRSRRSLIHDPTLIFRSSTIRYSLTQSEPRKHKRRHTTNLQFPNKHLVYLTPVRRSTRRNRQATSGEVCVDSPSQLLVTEGYSNATVEVVPNVALDFDQL